MDKRTKDALWRIYQRPPRPLAWIAGGSFPWYDEEFSRRMLQQHLDDSHGAASRRTRERAAQIEWLWNHLPVQPGQRILDLTCGPGLYALDLAQRDCHVTGVDISPSSIDYARQVAESAGVTDNLDFILGDVREVQHPSSAFDHVLLLYGQLAVFPPHEAEELVAAAVATLKPGGTICIELLAPTAIDRSDSSWWFTDDTGLWGNRPFLHLGERFWDTETRIATERYQILDIESGSLQEFHLCDQSYERQDIERVLRSAGVATIAAHPGWDGLDLCDGESWILYIARL